MNNCECNNPIEPKCKKVNGLTIVVIPAQSGSSAEGELYAPKIGDYKNTIVKYLADGLVYVYDDFGNWTRIADANAITPTIDTELNVDSDNPVTNRAISRAINELTSQIEDEEEERQRQDGLLQDAIDAEELARGNADTALQGAIDTEKTNRENADTTLSNSISSINTKINRDVMYDLEMHTDATSVTFKEDKINLNTGETSQEIDTIPSASNISAGTVSAAEYISIKNSQDRLDALEGGSVAVSGLPASPTQQELTTAWMNETGQSTLINRASIYDSTNTKVWTYYSNDTTWHEVTAGTIQVNPFTNSIAGTILGSTTDGNVSANLDGTGTVSGWSALKADVATKLTASDLDDVAFIDDTIGHISNTAYVGTANIQDDAVTTAKIADLNVTENKLATGSVTTNKIADGSVTSDKIDSTTLFSSSAGQGLGVFNLSDDIQNYRKIEVMFANVNNYFGSVSFNVVSGPNYFIMSTFQPGVQPDRSFYIQSAAANLTGTTGNIFECRGGSISNGSMPVVDENSSSNIRITSIVGYK